jgi:putative FmdB family regulatory protein
MPIFEFKCDKCGKEFERIVFGSEDSGICCPDCGCNETRKVLSVFSCSGMGKESATSCGSPSSGGFS